MFTKFSSDAIQSLNNPYIAAAKKRSGSSAPFLGLHKNINPFSTRYNDYPILDDSSLKNQYIVELTKECQSKGQHNNLELKEENILFVNGIAAGIDLLFKTVGNVPVSVAVPTFDLYEFLARTYGISCENITFFNFANDYNIEALRQLGGHQYKLIFVCSPNNPTGQIVPTEIIDNLLAVIDNNQFLIIDEAYIEFAENPSLVGLITNHPNLIILRTFSKAWGIAGARLGAIVANESIIHALRIAQVPFTISTPAMEVLDTVLKNGEIIRENCLKIINLREELLTKLQQFNWIKFPTRSQANFILIECNQATNLAEYLIKQKNIIVANQNKIINNTLRISIGSTEQHNNLIAALQDYEKGALNGTY